MKKIFLFLIASLLIVNNLQALQTWNGSASTAWTKGTGSEADPYLIETPAHLAYLSEQVKAGNTYTGVYFRQTDDFDLNSKYWTSIGTSTYMFAGVYDGGNKYISNLTNSIFGYVNNSKIKNLTLQGADINITSSSIRSFSSFILNTYGDCVIENCHNKVNFNITQSTTSSYDISCAGLVACVYGSSLSVDNSTNFGNMSIKNTGMYGMGFYCGGLIAIESGSSISIENSNNHGAISVNFSTSSAGQKATAHVGGLIGCATNATLLRCGNVGKINVKLYVSSSSSGAATTLWASGLVGAENMSNNVYEQCFNRGDVYADGSLDTDNIYGLGAGKLQKACYVICEFSPEPIYGGKDVMYAFGASEVESCYYISKGTNAKYTSIGHVSNVCYNTPTILDGGVYKSDMIFKAPIILSELNTLGDYFTMDCEGINDGYPILKWQAGTRYNINATCDPMRGTVKGGGEYALGNTVTLTATPQSGCTFVGWSDGNTDNPRTITVEGDATYIAQFTKSAYTIYVNQDGTSYIE